MRARTCNSAWFAPHSASATRNTAPTLPGPSWWLPQSPSWPLTTSRTNWKSTSSRNSPRESSFATSMRPESAGWRRRSRISWRTSKSRSGELYGLFFLLCWYERKGYFFFSFCYLSLQFCHGIRVPRGSAGHQRENHGHDPQGNGILSRGGVYWAEKSRRKVRLG